MTNITFLYEKAMDFFSEKELEEMKIRVLEKRDLLLSGKGIGNEFTGWLDLPLNYKKKEFNKIKEVAGRIQKDSDALIVIGIGGSYLGARAAIEFLKHDFYNLVDKDTRKTPEIYFAGNSISTDYLLGLINVIKDKDFSINVISKSGTTTEPAIAFRIFKKILEEKYGNEEAAARIYVTTDEEKGALKELATKEGYDSFVVPDDIGGRFSVLTAVGLLPIAVSGANIDELMNGAENGRENAINNPFESNGALQYAAIRNILLNKGKNIEILANYEPCLYYLSEWWKQLFGESEGKDGKGIFPSAVNFTTDLHSMGQYIQDGQRTLFETIMEIEKSDKSIIIEKLENDLDELNYLAGKDIDFVNKKALQGTMMAHVDGGVPNLIIKGKKKNELVLGELFYFFEFACAISGYTLGVNPFNQPGVESYKENMFALLGKPGYESQREDLLKKL